MTPECPSEQKPDLEGDSRIENLVQGDERIKYHAEEYVDLILDPETWNKNKGEPIFHEYIGKQGKVPILKQKISTTCSALYYEEDDEFIEM